jgi:hypothetical protein
MQVAPIGLRRKQDHIDRMVARSGIHLAVAKKTSEVSAEINKH